MDEMFWLIVMNNLQYMAKLITLNHYKDEPEMRDDYAATLWEQSYIIEQLLGQGSLPCVLLPDGTDMFSFVADEFSDIRPHYDFKNSVPVSAYWENNE